MRISSSAKCASIAAAVTLLAACNNAASQLEFAPSGATQQNAVKSILHAQPLRSSLATTSGAITAHPDHSRSWMDPDAKKDDLFYISDNGTDDVYIYAYEPGRGKTLVGTLTGFSSPKGICVDKAGNVFITNQVPLRVGPSTVVEYAHGGTHPIATLIDSAYYPYGCSVDPVTGNLAVTNASTSYSYGPGDVAIYPNAKGAPINYLDSDFDQYFFCGYDNKGNLFVDGLSSGSASEFAKLPKGSKTLKSITLNQTVQLPGGVQWDGKYVAIGDQIAATIYQFNVSGSVGTKVGITPLNGGNYVRQFWIYGRKVIGPDNQGANVKFWNYPGGGTATKSINNFKYPIAATVSPAK